MCLARYLRYSRQLGLLDRARLRPPLPDKRDHLRSSRRPSPDGSGQITTSKIMKSVTKGLLVAVGVSVALFLNAQPATAEQSLLPLSSERIAQIVRSSDRTAADRTNDERRKPEQMLRFIGIRPGIVAVDIS